MCAVKRFAFFGNLFGNRSVVFCFGACKAVRKVIDCFLEAIVHWMYDFEVLLVKVSKALTLVRTTALRSKA